MVFRKPYAFFIKNFRKFHIVLLILCAFIYSKTLQLSTFIDDFLKFMTYDAYYEPISKYIGLPVFLALLVVIIIVAVFVIVLKRKEKPWKLYLVPLLEYIALFIICIFITNFFNNYDGTLTSTTIRALDNFLSIASVFQYVVFLILIIRITGVDLKSFNFSADQEFLELTQEDREEFEVHVEFDKHAVSRTLRRTKRNLIYFYKEHQFLCNVAFTILTLFLLYRTYYYFGVSHKTIKENEIFNINNYSMIINKSYYTNKDKSGNILEKDSAFVILNLSVLNNGESREFNGNDFHIVNGNKSYTFQGNTYSNDFSDLGNSYPNGKLQHGEQQNFALIFKVDKDLDYKNFVLYFQKKGIGKNTYVRKIKLKLNNVSEIKEEKKYIIGQKVSINYVNGVKENFVLEDVSFQDSIIYNVEVCDAQGNCEITSKTAEKTGSDKIMVIQFASTTYDEKAFIDFSNNYGTIKYRDNNGMTKELKIVHFLKEKNYLGKYLYLKVPQELTTANSIEFIYTVRNQKYKYKIR